MKQQERTQRTKQKIIQAATCEFAEKGYEASSINHICSKNKIAKGLIYHNFKNKDDLYLCCIRHCFEKMLACFEQDADSSEKSQALERILRQRQKFFETNPQERNLFFYAVLQPPQHLQKEIEKIREPLNEYYKQQFEGFAQQISLRRGITPHLAMEYFMVFEQMFHTYFKTKVCTQQDFDETIKHYELSMGQMLDIMLYGISTQP